MAVVASGFLVKLTLEIRADPEKGKGNIAKENLSTLFIVRNLIELSSELRLDRIAPHVIFWE